MGTLYEVNQLTGGIGAPVLGESASNGVYSTLAHNNVKNQARLQYDSKTEGMQGITFAYADGEITLTGTATAQAYTFPAMSASGFDLEPDRHYIMTGIPSNAPEGVTLRLRYNDGGNKIIATDEGNGAEFEFTKAQHDASGGFHLMINVKSGTVIPAGGIVIKPMIRYVEDVDPTFEKHAYTNSEVTALLSKCSKFTKIWENPDPYTAYDGGDVNMDMTDYDMYMVMHIANITHSGKRFVTNFGLKGFGVDTICWDVNAIGRRWLTYYNGVYTFGPGATATTLNPGSYTNNGNYLVPYQIYGIKL